MARWKISESIAVGGVNFFDCHQWEKLLSKLVLPLTKAQ
jgi:hypothetical protein